MKKESRDMSWNRRRSPERLPEIQTARKRNASGEKVKRRRSVSHTERKEFQRNKSKKTYKWRNFLFLHLKDTGQSIILGMGRKCSSIFRELERNAKKHRHPRMRVKLSKGKTSPNNTHKGRRRRRRRNQVYTCV